jgi:uncharacterized Zn finger protein (UPF0148 family)
MAKQLSPAQISALNALASQTETMSCWINRNTLTALVERGLATFMHNERLSHFGTITTAGLRAAAEAGNTDAVAAVKRIDQAREVRLNALITRHCTTCAAPFVSPAGFTRCAKCAAWLGAEYVATSDEKIAAEVAKEAAAQKALADAAVEAAKLREAAEALAAEEAATAELNARRAAPAYLSLLPTPAHEIAADGQNWSDEQRKIFAWFKSGRGNLVVRARAGTGKTTSILRAIDDAPESRILLAAFNKSIAVELQAKLRNPRAEAKTLHSLGYGFLARAWGKLRIDDKISRDLARRAAPMAPDALLTTIAKVHTKVREIAPFTNTVEEVLDLAMAFDLLPGEEWEDLGWNDRAICEAALKAVHLAKERRTSIDFADMIFLPLIHNLVRPTYSLVVVDEAQDMSASQITLARRACNGRIAVVGDDRQAIYGFRGADSGSLDRLKSELNAVEMGLTTTYRCPKVVVARAAQLVPDYKAAPTAPLGEIRINVSKEKMLDTAREGDFILSRKNSPLVSVCLTLLKRGIRARIKGRDIGAGLLAKIRTFRLTDLADLPRRCAAWQAEERRRLQGVDADVAAERLEMIVDQCELFTALADGLATVQELESRISALFVENAEQQAVMCSSVHKAKGLEADNVFLLQGTFKKKGGEEDNILYVAITRTKSVLSWVDGY